MKVLHLYFDDADKVALDQAAKAAHQTRAGWCRRLILAALKRPYRRPSGREIVDPGATSQAVSGPDPAEMALAVAGLVKVGWTEERAKRSCAILASRSPGARAEELIAEALRQDNGK